MVHRLCSLGQGWNQRLFRKVWALRVLFCCLFGAISIKRNVSVKQLLKSIRLPIDLVVRQPVQDLRARQIVHLLMPDLVGAEVGEADDVKGGRRAERQRQIVLIKNIIFRL